MHRNYFDQKTQSSKQAKQTEQIKHNHFNFSIFSFHFTHTLHSSNWNSPHHSVSKLNIHSLKYPRFLKHLNPPKRPAQQQQTEKTTHAFLTRWKMPIKEVKDNNNKKNQQNCCQSQFSSFKKKERKKKSMVKPHFILSYIINSTL